MKQRTLIIVLCLFICPSAMAADFGLMCEKKHGNGKYIMYLVRSGYEAFVIKDNLFRGHVIAGTPQSVGRIKSTESTDIYRKDYWGGRDTYTVNTQGGFIRSESTIPGQEKNDEFDENCGFLSEEEIESIFLKAQRQPQSYSNQALMQ